MPFLDWDEQIIKRFGKNLQHWHQPGKMQFVTFRLADSLPQSKIGDILKIKADFEARYQKPWSDEVKLLYHRFVGPVEERLLDNGYGSCLLRYHEIRHFLTESLFYGDGKRYDIWAYVIMPNHVHALMSDIMGEDINDILKSIKQFSANRINKKVGRKGEFWMRENFDRLVRSEAHFDYCLDYIINNPRHIRSGEYELYVKSDLIDARDGEMYGGTASQPSIGS